MKTENSNEKMEYMVMTQVHRNSKKGRAPEPLASWGGHGDRLESALMEITNNVENETFENHRKRYSDRARRLKCYVELVPEDGSGVGLSGWPYLFADYEAFGEDGTLKLTSLSRSDDFAPEYTDQQIEKLLEV